MLLGRLGGIARQARQASGRSVHIALHGIGGSDVGQRKAHSFLCQVPALLTSQRSAGSSSLCVSWLLLAEIAPVCKAEASSRVWYLFKPENIDKGNSICNSPGNGPRLPNDFFATYSSITLDTETVIDR